MRTVKGASFLKIIVIYNVTGYYYNTETEYSERKVAKLFCHETYYYL